MLTPCRDSVPASGAARATGVCEAVPVEDGTGAPRTGRTVAIVVLVLGAVTAAVAGVKTFSPVVDLVTHTTRVPTPGLARLDLGAGEYIVYERTGTRRSAGNFTVGSFGPESLIPGTVHVRGPDGRQLPVTVPGSSETITLGSSVYTGALAFRAETPGTYEVTIVRPVGDVLVGRSLGSTFGRVWRWAVLLVAGAIAAVAGVIALAVGASRRRRADRAVAYPPGPPPPGWYPDPAGGGGRRYWDGRAWTGHVA